MDTLDSNTVPFRVCTKCGQSFPATPEFFHRNKVAKYGLQPRCKKCMSEASGLWYRKNTDRARACSNIWRAANAEKKRVSDVAYEASHVEQHRARTAAWAAANSERKRATNLAWAAANPESRRAACAKWRAAHPEKARATNLACKAANREKNAARAANWQKANSEATCANSSRRRAHKRVAPGNHTADDIKRIYADQHGLCAYCGCDLNETGYHTDHVIPLSRPGTSNGPENLVVACPACNSSKKDKLLEDWFPTR